MSRKAEFIQATDVELFDPLEDEPKQPKTDAENKTDALASALADDENAFLSITKNDDGREIFVERVPADKFDYGQIQNYLKETYGGGDYRIRLYANGKIRQNKLISIARVMKKDSEAIQAEGMAGVIQQLINRMDRQDQALSHLLAGRVNNDDAEEKMLQKMLVYKQLFADNNSHSTVDPLQQIQSTLGVLNSLGVQIGGQQTVTESEPGFGDLIDKLTPLAEIALKNNMTQPSQPTQRKPNPINDPKREMFMKWKQGITFLLNGAKTNSDAGMYAELVIGQMGASQVKNFLMMGDAGTKQLRSMFPEINQHATWFTNLFEHLKAQVGLPSAVDSEYDDLTNDDDVIIPEQNAGSNDTDDTIS